MATWELVQDARLLRPREQAWEVSLKEGADRVPRIGSKEPSGQGLQHRAVEPRRGALDQPVKEPGEVRAKPLDGAELNRVRRLVDRDPAQEEIGLLPELGVGIGEVRSHEQQARLPVRGDQGHVVLPQHPAGAVSDRHAGLGPGRCARDRAYDAAKRPRCLQAVGDSRLELPGQLAQRAQAHVDPLASIDDLRGRERPSGLEPGVVDDQLPGVCAGGPDGRLGERSRVLPGARHPGRDAASKAPVDEPVHGLPADDRGRLRSRLSLEHGRQHV